MAPAAPEDIDFGLSGRVANSMDTDEAAKLAEVRTAARFTRHGKVSRPVTQPPEQWLSKKSYPWARTVRRALRKFWNNNFDEIIMAVYSLQILAGWCFHLRVPWLLSLAVILVSYVEENFRFVFGHFCFHAAFWEFKDIGDMDVPTAAACRHHNGEPWIFMERWAEYRMYFIFQREKWFFEEGWYSLISPHSIQGRHNLKSLAVWLLCGFNVMMVYRAWMIYNSVMQQIVHEWYHTPVRYRGKQFILLFPMLYAMEAVGIISTATHKQHHKSDGTDEQHTEQFFDMLVPNFCEVLANRVYQYVMRDSNRGWVRACNLHFWGTLVTHVGSITLTFAASQLSSTQL